MEKDVFCKIIDGEIPAHVVYEDNDVIAILDISQVTKGHTLVIPKKHYDTFLATPNEIMHKVMDVAQKIGQVMIDRLHAKGVNILTNCYEAAGQTVPHFHVHVIPRYLGGEGGFQITMKASDASSIDLPRLAFDIKNAMK